MIVTAVILILFPTSKVGFLFPTSKVGFLFSPSTARTRHPPSLRHRSDSDRNDSDSNDSDGSDSSPHPKWGSSFLSAPPENRTPTHHTTAPRAQWAALASIYALQWGSAEGMGWDLVRQDSSRFLAVAAVRVHVAWPGWLSLRCGALLSRQRRSGATLVSICALQWGSAEGMGSDLVRQDSIRFLVV